MRISRGMIPQLFVLLLIALPLGESARAEIPIVLTVLGAIGVEGQRIDLRMADLEDMDPVTVRTHTPWTDGVQDFTGVLMSHLLERVKARGQIVEAIALNDYKAMLSRDELSRYPVIIAFKRNGAYMRVRDKGPLWIIYPQDDYTELQSLDTEHKMVWQLRTLIVK